MSRPVLDARAALAEMLGDITGLDAADIGAGSGRATRLLAEMGARAVGVEPNPDAVAAAEAKGGGPRYLIGTAEATGLPAASVDIVLFSYSLHHVPDMPGALAEAERILRADGRIAVLEPEAGDPLYPAVRLIDDEAPVYAAAQAAIDAAVASGRLVRTRSLQLASRYRPTSPDALVSEMTRVDPTRSLDPADRPAFEAAFAAAIETDADGPYAETWERVDLLSRPI